MAKLRVELVGLSLALLPFSQGVGQVDIGLITVNPHMLLTLLLAFSGLFRVTIFGKKYSYSQLDTWVILLLATYFSSTVLSDTLTRSGFLAFHGLFLPASCYFVIKSNVETIEEMKRILNWLIVGVVVFCVWDIITLIEIKRRIVVLGVPPIGVATMIVLASAYLFGAGQLKSKMGKIAFIIMATAFLASLSRMYIVLVIFSLFFYVVIRRGYALGLLKTMLLSTLCLTLILVASAGWFANAKIDNDERRGAGRVLDVQQWKRSLYGRAFDYQEAIEAFKQKPVFGSGLKKGEITVTRHNLHMEWLEYGGMLGYVLYMGVLLAMFRRPAKFASSDTLIASGLLGSFIVLGNSVTNGLMHGMMPYAVFITAGINMVLVRFRNNDTEKSEQKTYGKLLKNVVVKKLSFDVKSG